LTALKGSIIRALSAVTENSSAASMKIPLEYVEVFEGFQLTNITVTQSKGGVFDVYNGTLSFPLLGSHVTLARVKYDASTKIIFGPASSVSKD
jgi:hypothetical protein